MIIDLDLARSLAATLGGSSASVVAYLQVAQHLQDSGPTWGQAYDAVEGGLAMPLRRRRRLEARSMTDCEHHWEPGDVHPDWICSECGAREDIPDWEE